MTKQLFIIGSLMLASASAFAECESEARAFIENTYEVQTVEARQLGGKLGEGSPQDREVWVKAANGSTYSVFFDHGSCAFVRRHIAWR